MTHCGSTRSFKKSCHDYVTTCSICGNDFFVAEIYCKHLKEKFKSKGADKKHKGK